MKIGLFFGSFNPIHVGHLIIANYIKEYSDLDRIWFVVSPQNPLKKKASLLDDYHRLELVNRAVKGYDDYEESSIEFNLPKPSYTIDTLVYMKERYPSHDFQIIMGSDNLKHFHKWKNFEILLRDYEIIVYPRPTFDVADFKYEGNLKVVNAPLMEISSSLIRKMYAEGKDPSFFLAPSVYQYIEEMHFYGA
ncbi:nicotinate-nucleotide adenylyltransferase [Balneicella halophila]|uniref:Probable nicotinate-nucleotide adenylyltransferase n=1 Tax=Balneicella halophila TaxID=1537566 RepID=A0A7L4UMH6_BALHA|nr:nicotinate (nicotinamide) nucleotide adenylyltransferase [Balneicella halophila]PVX49821.1 nicotinate-nucleotide adenylyltransferase [Balneicella halophila]